MIRTLVVSSLLAASALGAGGLEKEKLEFKFKEGARVSVQTTSRIHQVLGIAGMDLETKGDSTITVSSSVGKRGADGRLAIEQKVEALAVELSLPMGLSISFDSSNPKDDTDGPLKPIMDAYRARVGSTYSLVLDKNNKVLAVEGAEKLLESVSPETRVVLQNDVNSDLIRQGAEQAYAIFPSEPVGKGDTWTRTQTDRIGGGQSLTFQTRFEHQGTIEKGGKKLDKIRTQATSVTYAMDPNVPSPLKVTQSELKIASSEGTILFDRAEGRVQESKSLTRIKGDLTFLVNGMDFPSTLELTFDSASAVQK